MSRLDAALHRATTGFVAETPEREAEAPEPELAYEAIPIRDRTVVRHEARGPQQPSIVESPIGGEALDLQLEGFRPDHAEKPSIVESPIGGEALDLQFEGFRPDHAEKPSIVESPIGGEALDLQFEGFSPDHAEKLITSETLPPSLREQFRRLGAMLHHSQASNGMKLLMISSAAPNEGKTLTATNIALTLSESYRRRVLLIDGDLRRPSLDKVFQVPVVFGLSEALSSEPERSVSLIQISKTLSLLPAGKPNSDPMSVLTSDRMRRLLAEAAATFDWVIIDTPPVGILTDANLLGSIVDSAILVVRAGKTSAAEVQRAVQALGREKILGVVLNRAERRYSSEADSYYYASYYSGKR